MQRLKQHNIGMRLRLTEEEFLVAQGPVFPNRGTVRRVRMRVERGGCAERSYHEIAPQHSVFNYCSTQFDGTRLAELGWDRSFGGPQYAGVMGKVGGR